MDNIINYYNQIINGDCIKIMQKLPSNSCDLIFADPPYNLQLSKQLYRPNNSCVKGVNEDWDKFDSFKKYDEFSIQWLKEAQRVLKKNGTIWVMGSYHNIFRLGKIMQDLDFWILNDIIWQKSNPMPNFKGVRFTNSQETLIWAKRKESDPSYFFNYNAMKLFNGDVQMNSIWKIPICSGKERLKFNGIAAHPTQKPLALLFRIILSSTKKGDLILDPFFGTGTLGVAAIKLHRNFIGIESNKNYVNMAKERINSTVPLEEELLGKVKGKRKKVSLGNLLEVSLISAGDIIFNKNYKCKAKVCVDGSLLYNNNYFSINNLTQQLSKGIQDVWSFWSVNKNNSDLLLSMLRELYIDKLSENIFDN